jgi:hypothetical protein
MGMTRDGNFSYDITFKNLIHGLRPSKRATRNSNFLTLCNGAVGRDTTLQAIDQLTRIDTSSLNCSFPYPQIFVFNLMTIVCTGTSIYELVDSSLELKLTTVEYLPWTAIEFFEYVYLSNGLVAVTRDVGSFAYSITTDLPAARSICNFNGQVIIDSIV